MQTIHRRTVGALLATTSAFCLLASAGAASAQDSAALEEIVVTARKTGENLIEVPVAITAITGENLAARGVTGLNELNDFVPGLRYQNSAANRNDRSFTTISIRGMYPGDSPNRQAATVFIDGVAISGGSIPGMTDVERVEVVNGPQSAYFGRSTFAGALNFITRAPGYDHKANASLSVSSYDTIELSAGIEGAIIPDVLAARLSARHYETGGQYDNFGFSGKLGARQTQSVALSVLFEPMESLRVRGFGTYWEDSDGPTAQAGLNFNDYTCAANPAQPNVRNYVCGGIGSAPANRMSQNIVAGSFADQFLGTPAAIVDEGLIDGLGLERKQYVANVQFDYDVADHTLSGSAAVNGNEWAVLTDTYNRAPDGTGYASTVYLPYDMSNYSAEIRLSSNPDKAFRYSIGANYFSEDINFQTRAYRPSNAAPNPAVLNLTQPTVYTARTKGVFASVQYDFTDALTLSVEGRYQWDTIGQQIKIPGGADLEETFQSFSPRAILSYSIRDDLEVYASAAQGTRPGSFNVFLTTATPFVRQQILSQFAVPLEVPEEKLTMYELGLKGDFLDGRLRILSALYYGQWRDRQINQNIAYLATPGANSTSTSTLALPGGEVDLWGVELQGQFRVTDELSLEGTFNYAETEIVQTRCTECVAINGVLNPVGNRLPRYPAYSGTFSAQYERPVTGTWDGFARMDYIYTGRIYASEANVVWTEPAHRVNASIGLKNEAYTVELFGRNVFDDKTPTNILRNADPRTGQNMIILAPPERQTFGVRAAVRY